MRNFIAYIALFLFTASVAIGAAYITGDTVRSPDRTKTWGMPAASDTLVGRASTDTLTGKTMSGASNTFSNIADTALSTISTAGKVSNSATTATDANTASAIVARDVSGNFSAGTITANLTGNVTGAVTGNASTATALAANPSDCAADTYATTIAASGNLTCATVTNAGLAGSIAASKLVGTDIATVGTVTTGTWHGTKVSEAYGGTNQSTYASGDMLYASASNTLSKLAIGSAGQVIKQVGGVPTWATFSGGINYMSSNPDAESNAVSPWVTYDDAASAPVDGTGGVVTTTWTATSSSPLRGTYSFLLTKDAANRQGEGAAYDFTIDAADKGQVLQVSFDYLVASGTYADGDLTVYLIEDPSGTPVVIQPAPYTILNASVAQRWQGTFQTSTSVTSYRLVIHVASTSASAYTVKFDNFEVGPQKKSYGPAVTDWVSYTPTGSWTANSPTYTGRWRRVGDSMEGEVRIVLGGAATAASLTINLPSGYTIDTSKLTAASYNYLGGAQFLDSATGWGSGFVAYSSTTAVAVKAIDTAVAGNISSIDVDATHPQTWAINDIVVAHFSVPITGWSSGQLLSSDAETRVVAANYYTTAGANADTSGNFAIVDMATKGFDTHGAVTTGASWKFTAPVSGYYRASVTFSTSGGASSSTRTYVAVKKNATTNVCVGSVTRGNGAGLGATCSGNVYLNVGDYLSPYYTQDGGGTYTFDTGVNTNAIFIEKLSGPSQIAASESVNASYTGTPTGTIASTYGSSTAVTFPTKVKDTHNAYSSGTYTIPVSGSYSISASGSMTASSYADLGYTAVGIFKNGSIIKSALKRQNGTTVNGTHTDETAVMAYPFIAGDTVTIRFVNSNTTPAFTALLDGSEFSFSISRVGN